MFYKILDIKIYQIIYIIISILLIMLFIDYNYTESFVNIDKPHIKDTPLSETLWNYGCIGSHYSKDTCTSHNPFYWNPSNNRPGVCCHKYPKRNNRHGPDHHNAGYGCVQGEYRDTDCNIDEYISPSIPNNFPGICCIKK